MSHPSSRSETVDGIVVEAKSFKRNLWLYKSIGGEVTVRSTKTSRRWWCLWLCRTPDPVEADRIEIENRYFARIDGTPFLVDAAVQEKTCSDASDCSLKHFAFGFGVKLTFPRGESTPSTFPDLLPLDGVISRARVEVGGRSLDFETAAGSHPS